MRTAQESVHLIAAVVGFTSFAALWAGTLWGTVLRSGWAGSRVRHATVHGIHMHVTLFGLWLGVVHGLAQLADPYGKVGVQDLVVPFGNRADPVGIGMGVLALEMLLATGLSVLLQRRLGYHRWRGLHSLGYLAFTLVAAHVLVSGSELAAAGPRVAVAAAWAVVVAAGALTLAPVARLPRLLLDRATSRRRAEEVTVSVDPGRCASFGFCEHEAPGIFSLRSDQRLAYRSVAPSDQTEAVVRAAVVCPARAITLGRLPTAVVVARPDGPEPGPQDVPPSPPPPPQQPPPRPAPVFQRPRSVAQAAALEDTGRHHLRPLRGVPGGRVGGAAVSRSEYGPRDRILVVGGGAAGWAAAAELRRRGFAGDVTVVSAEPVRPYDRTACSKGLLDGRQRPQDTLLDLTGCPGVRWRTGVRAESLDPYARRVVLSTGEAVGYDGLVVATGTRAALPADWPLGRPGLHLLHDLSDAWSLRAALASARRVAVVGGGLTGCEVACAAVAMARRAVLVNSRPYLLPRSVGEQVGTLLTAAHRAAGIELRLGRSVAAAERRPLGWRLLLDDGDAVEADLVVVAAGEKPDLAWLAGTPADLTDGVLCDETLRVTGLDGVVAAGALARWPNLRYGRRPARVGQWISAVEQGQGAARTLLAGDREAPPVALLPRFWSDQNGLRIQVCGRLDRSAEVVLTELRPRRRDTARAGVVASYVERGRVAGVVAVNAPRAFAVACRMLLAEPLPAPVRPPVLAPVPAPVLLPTGTGPRSR